MANPANSTAYRGGDGRLYVNVTEAKTLGAADSGYVQNVIASVTCTLPATATQGVWTIRNGGTQASSSIGYGSGADGLLISVDPNGSDTIAGFDVATSAADGKQLNNTATTARVGDEVTIINSGATDGPLLVEMKGVWAREA